MTIQTLLGMPEFSAGFGPQAMSNLFDDWFPEEVMKELENTDTSVYDILPEEMLDDRPHWDQYDEMPWNG